MIKHQVCTSVAHHTVSTGQVVMCRAETGRKTSLVLMGADTHTSVPYGLTAKTAEIMDSDHPSLLRPQPQQKMIENLLSIKQRHCYQIHMVETCGTNIQMLNFGSQRQPRTVFY